MAAGPENSMSKCSVDARTYEMGAIESVQVQGAADSLCKTSGKDRWTGKARCKETEMIGSVPMKGHVEVECK